MGMIQPIDDDQKCLVAEVTTSYLDRARELYQSNFDEIAVTFDLCGKTAGMYRHRNGERAIRYNPYLFAKYFADSLAVTIPHEVAHYVSDMVYGLGNIRPHGKEWKRLMAYFGADDSRTCDYDMDGIRQRVYKRFPYQCHCTQHQLTSRRHNQIRAGKKTYLCRQCGSSLAPLAHFSR